MEYESLDDFSVLLRVETVLVDPDKNYINQLPTCLLRYLFSFLHVSTCLNSHKYQDDRETVKNLRIMCRRFSRLLPPKNYVYNFNFNVLIPTRIKVLSPGNYVYMCNSNYLTMDFHKWPLTHLNLEENFTKNESIIPITVERLKLGRCYYVNLMEHINLKYIRINEMIQITLPATIEKLKYFGDGFLDLSRLINLRQLYVSNQESLNSASRDLEFLSAKYCNLDLQFYDKLQELIVFRCNLLELPPNLKRLTIKDFTEMTDFSHTNLRYLELKIKPDKIYNFPPLEILIINGQSQQDFSQFAKIVIQK